MSFVKNAKAGVRSLAGVALVLFVAVGIFSYFSNSISLKSFGLLAFVVATLALVLAYFGWLAVRAGIMFVVIAAILLLGVCFGKRPDVDSSKFQSVTLTTGQIYFGHLSNINSANATLKDVYTLQTTQQPTTTNGKTTTATKPILVNLSKGLTGPENEMTIRTDKVLYWQNLQDSSKVTEAIKKDLNIQ